MKLAYDEGVRMLEHQRASIDEIRARAGLVLAGGAIVAAVLGAEALKTGEHLHWTGWAGVTSFVLLATATTAVRWPVKWGFLTSPEQLLDEYVYTDDAFDVDQLRADLARKMDRRYRNNERKTDLLFLGITISLITLVGEVLFLLAQLRWG